MITLASKIPPSKAAFWVAAGWFVLALGLAHEEGLIEREQAKMTADGVHVNDG
jgi:hypothetical protein